MRKLYAVRWFPEGCIFGRTVGFKCRLLPRNAALRVVKRLKRGGLDVEAYPFRVNTTKYQDARIRSMYGV